MSCWGAESFLWNFRSLASWNTLNSRSVNWACWNGSGWCHVVYCYIHVGRVSSSCARKPLFCAWPGPNEEAVTLNNCNDWFVCSTGKTIEGGSFLLPLFLSLHDVKRQAQIAGELVSMKCHPRPTQFYSASFWIFGDGFRSLCCVKLKSSHRSQEQFVIPQLMV